MCFEQAVSAREPLRDLHIADHAGFEPRQRLRLAGDVVRELLDEIHRRVQHAVAPAFLHRPCTGVQLTGVDDRHAARLGDVVRAKIPVAFGAGDDHRDGVRVVPVRRELVVVIFSRKQIRAGQKRRTPVAGGIAESRKRVTVMMEIQLGLPV